ncbi:esterase-like activity of phytase family protein [Bauldia sp.]|uniref:esterase-like activity of phytase family protein n=1 Tax=Bauldia sp. TaxID=2575872 RepID=UPI003BABDFF8
MTILRVSAAAAALLACTALTPASAAVFNRVATFHVADNAAPDADPTAETAAEIIAATGDGNTLIYSDSPGERLGIIDITDPTSPMAGGTIALDGEPTSVVIAGDKALVGIVTSESYTTPSGHLAIVDLTSKATVATCDLGGQPDSLALSPDGSFVAIAIENERDEDLGEGGLPQLPAGNLTYYQVAADGTVDCGTQKVVDLTGLAEVAPEDPEPEFVDINSANQAVVSLQENNHLAIVDLTTGEVVSSFSAGAVDLDQIDTMEEDAITLNSSLAGVVREPDAIKWIGNDRILTANEGDWNGGSRGFTIFDTDGNVLYDSGNSVEHLAVSLGHYPEGRSENKGSEPEGAEVGVYGDDTLLFVGLERASLVLVYQDTGAEPTYLQALPGGIGPEGLVAIPDRDLFVAAAEVDLGPDGGIGSVVTIYQRMDGESNYPQLVSGASEMGTPIPWMAVSGTVADPSEAGKLYAVTDSASSVARILTIDATQTPALITAEVTITDGGNPAANLDPEGIAMASDGTFWIASEGNPERDENKTNSTLLHVAPDGAIQEVVTLPEAVLAQAKRFGFEGVAVTGSADDQTVWVAVQREWNDDPKGLVKLMAYKPSDKSWSMVHYPLETPEAGWIGLSEITAVGNDSFLVVERDNQIGPNAKVKQLTYVSLADIAPVAPGAEAIPVVEKVVVRDLIPDLLSPNGYVMDKIESLAVDSAGNAFIITDNDGVDDHSGETVFINIGPIDLPM